MITRKNNPIRILVIEDDADILNALNIVLSSVGFDVDVLLQGASIMKNDFVLPDLFIIDKKLPNVDGLKICRYLRSRSPYKDIPIIVISADPRCRKKAIAAGASHFIEKPFEVPDLVNTINKLLQMKSVIS
jgi:DNA-binding response OmpR family regulator